MNDLRSRTSSFVGTFLGPEALHCRATVLLASLILITTLTWVPTAGGFLSSNMSLGPVGAAFEDNGTLVLAVAVRNEGKQSAESVTVESIKVEALGLSPSVKLPITLGSIHPNKHTILRAAFNQKGEKDFKQKTVYVIHISGKYRQDGKARSFLVSRPFRPERQPTTATARKSSVLPRKVDGGKFRPLLRVPPKHQVGDDEDFAPLPVGAARKGFRPASPNTSLAGREPKPRLERIKLDAATMPLQGPNDPVEFRTHKIVGAPSSFYRPPEPTGATSYITQSPPLDRDVVFAAGNTSAALSLDGGSSFATIDPTSVFDFRDASGNPIDGNGLCCDQVVDYIPSVNKYVWVMMTVNRGTGALPTGPNRLRIAAASPQDIVGSGGRRWTFFDLQPSNFGWSDTRWFDRPDIAYGDRYLYVTADVIDPRASDMVTARGRMVARIPLARIGEGTVPMPIEFMEPEFSSRAHGSCVAQHSGDTAFWAAHITEGRVRIYSWPESSATASQHDVMVYRWSAADYSSLDPEGRQWLPGNIGKITAGTRRSGVGLPGHRAREVWFAWSAGRDTTFSQPWVDVLRIDASDFSYIRELPIWNPAYGFAYPSLTVNSGNEVGIAAAWGGAGVNYGNTAVGILGDFVLWITGTSDMSAEVRVRRGTETVSIPTFGDYLTVRSHTPDGFLYSGYTYQVKRDPENPGLCDGAVDGCRFDVIFTLFGRRSRIR